MSSDALEKVNRSILRPSVSMVSECKSLVSRKRDRHALADQSRSIIMSHRQDITYLKREIIMPIAKNH